MGNGLCGGYEGRLQRELEEKYKKIQEKLQAADVRFVEALYDFLEDCAEGRKSVQNVMEHASYLKNKLDKKESTK